MKKRIYVFVLLVAVCAFALAACSAADSSKVFGTFYRRVENEAPVYSDDNATIDGDLSEVVWKNAAWHDMKSTEGNRVGNNAIIRVDDCDVSATLVTSDKGMYLAARSSDKIGYVGDLVGVTGLPMLRRSAFGQTGVTVLFIDYAELYSFKGIYEIGFGLDGAVACHYHENRVISDVELKGVRAAV